MIESANELPADSNIGGDLCIVGAGAAGITLALSLRNTGLNVILLEAGGETERAENTDTYRGEVADAKLHSPTHHYRHRVLGGSTLTWGGRCIPFDPVDFERRDWIPNSGWPIAYEEVARYYGEAMQFAEAGDNIFSATAAIDGGMKPMIAGFTPPRFDADAIERFSRPTNFGRRYRNDLERAGNIRVITDANCLEVVTNPGESTVDHVVIATLDGRKSIVRCRNFVLATGGIETPRLLLASRRYSATGLANAHDLVGRYYMCHIAGTIGEARISVPSSNVHHGYERSWDGIYCRRRLHLRAEAQRDLKAGNMVFRLHHPRLSDPQHGRGVLSAIYLAKPLVSYEYAKRLHSSAGITLGMMVHHVLNVIREPFHVLRFAWHLARERKFAARKFPSLIVEPRNNVYSLDIHAEQVPNAESRITLSTETDGLGMPRVRVDWRNLPVDIEGVARGLKAFAEDLAASGKGSFVFHEAELANDLLRDGAFGGHHIGTTRMAARPEEGVVDGNCRVHGIDNLFIASSSVFPTSGQANPTLTILALTLRLSDHLKRAAAGPPIMREKADA